jgi:hypothetical protein
MSATTTIPVTISAEAADQIAKLGMTPSLERMIEHTRKSVTGLTHV